MAKRRRRRVRRSRKSSSMMSKGNLKWVVLFGVGGFVFWKFILPKLRAPLVIDPQITLGPMTITPAQPTYTLSPDAAIMGLGALLNG